MPHLGVNDGGGLVTWRGGLSCSRDVPKPGPGKNRGPGFGELPTQLLLVNWMHWSEKVAPTRSSVGFVNSSAFVQGTPGALRV
jgi:hypothetical protein